MKEGAFLYYIMDTLIHNIIQNGKLIHIKGKIMQDLEQVFYCLYDHPSKKNKVFFDKLKLILFILKYKPNILKLSYCLNHNSIHISV